MITAKKIIFSVALISLGCLSFADEWDDFDAMEDESIASPVLQIGGMVELNARGYVEASDSTYNSSTGEIDYEDRPGFGEVKPQVFPTGKIDFNYSGANTDLFLRVKLDKTSLYDGYYWDILDEFTARAYIGNAQFEAGKMRVVWGKGDKLHVLDNFNANDYTDYIIPDYIDRRISEPMFRAVYSTNSNVKFEGIYTPFMTADRLGTGIWQPKASKKLTTKVSEYAKTKLKSAYADYTTLSATVGTLSSLGASAQAAATAKAECESNVTTLSNLVAQYGSNAYAAYNTAKGTSITAEEFAALQTQASIALAAATVDDKEASGAYAAALTKTGYASIDAAEAAYQASAEWLNTLSSASTLNSDSSVLYPDTYQLKYGQFGFRTTFTVASADLGFSYYYGHNKQPSFNALKFNAGMDAYLANGSLSEDEKFLDYDKLQVFGFEAAGVLFTRLNSRLEFAYNLTDDVDGDDPAVHNNSLAWVAGFDVDLPIHNVNFNVQTQGKYILKTDEIEDSIYKRIDVDFDDSGYYTNSKLVVDITDTWNHEKVKLDLKGIWGIERGDLLIMPTLTFNIKDDFNLNLSGLYIWCNSENSEFDGWERNSFAQVGVKYQF